MSENLVDNKRIAKNTVFLYLRMLILILIQLYTVPVILQNLGISDYGIYNAVGGIVTMFSFIGSSLSSGSQRFLSFALGKNVYSELKKVFDSTVSIYLFFTLIIIIASEAVGYYFLNAKMRIPPERMTAANWVFQLSIIAFTFNIMAVPFNSEIIAHERMTIFAYVSIVDGVLKLLAAISLKYLHNDLLIYYAIFISIIAVINFLIYFIYCRSKFQECLGYKFNCDKKIGKSLISYSGLNMVGSLAIIGRNQGMNLIMNVFFGPILNAAHSLAQQVYGLLTQLINNVYTATRPQITKLYARGAEDSMWRLVFKSSKWTYFLLILISIPAIIEMDQVLTIWLKEVPEYTVVITRILIISLIMETMANQLIGAFQAKNKIKKYQLISSSILLLNLPLTYVILKFLSESPIVPYICTAIISIFYVVSLLWVASEDINLDVKQYVSSYLSRMILVTVLASVSLSLLVSLLAPTPIRMIITSAESIIIAGIIIYLFGTDKEERQLISSKISKIYKY